MPWPGVHPSALTRIVGEWCITFPPRSLPPLFPLTTCSFHPPRARHQDAANLIYFNFAIFPSMRGALPATCPLWARPKFVEDVDKWERYCLPSSAEIFVSAHHVIPRARHEEFFVIYTNRASYWYCIHIYHFYMSSPAKRFPWEELLSQTYFHRGNRLSLARPCGNFLLNLCLRKLLKTPGEWMSGLTAETLLQGKVIFLDLPRHTLGNTKFSDTSLTTTFLLGTLSTLSVVLKIL